MSTIGEVCSLQGHPVSIGIAAVLAGVSSRRMYDLCREGRVQTVVILGQRHVVAESLARRADGRRKVPQV